MLKINENNFKLGLLGGGQLGRMFIQEAINYNLSVSVLDPDKNAPCAQLASSFTVGDLNDFESVYQFGKQVNLLSIEIENVNIEALEKLENEGLPVFPQPSILRMIKDKALQKEFFKSNGIPTADFFVVQNKAEIEKHKSHFPFMQKLRTGGYDGKGVTKLANEKDLEQAFDAPSVLEKFVAFEKEIAIIGARNSKGEVQFYPAVEMEFNPEANLVEFLFAPASLDEQVESQAKEISKKILNKTGIVGVLAIEFFVTSSGQVLVNEMAPRPHNSGHHTIEANYTSQFEQHLRAILNMPLGSTKLMQPAVLINLLGEPDYAGDAQYIGLEEVLKEEGVFVHLYGKKKTKAFRKMGHVTILNESLDIAKRKALFVKKVLKVIAN
jgi:5-(carboxyamino)imidazole ribonucleotide synthase